VWSRASGGGQKEKKKRRKKKRQLWEKFEKFQDTVQRGKVSFRLSKHLYFVPSAFK